MFLLCGSEQDLATTQGQGSGERNPAIEISRSVSVKGG